MADSLVYSCDFCEDKHFSTKGNLKKHYVKFHGGIPQSFHGLTAKPRDWKPCQKCGSIFKSLAKHVEICKASGSSAKAEKPSIFVSSTRNQASTEKRDSGMDDKDTDSDFIPASPRKRQISELFDLSDHFDKWMIANGLGLRARREYICPLQKYFGKLNIKSVQKNLPNLPTYLKSLETINARRKLFLAHIKLVSFLNVQIGLDVTAFDPPTMEDCIEMYLKSDNRKALYHNFTNITKAMDMGWTPEDIHDFLMGEVILSNKDGKNFIFNCTLADFVKVDRPDDQGRWWYESSHYRVFFPDFLKQMLKSFAFIVRPKLLCGKTSHEVKFFDLYEKAGKPCAKNGSALRYVEMFSKTVQQIKVEKVLEAKFNFTWFKWSDFEGEIKGFDSRHSKQVQDFSEQEFNEDGAVDEEEAVEAETSIVEQVQMDIDHSLRDNNDIHIDHSPDTKNDECTSPQPLSSRPFTSCEKQRRSHSSLDFTEEEIQNLKSFFKKYKASDLNGQTVMVVLQFEDDVEELLDAKQAASGMGSKQFWQALALIIKENM